jgi:hypothetical protein
MSKEGAAKKNIFKQVFKDGWDEFKARHPCNAGMDKVVQKMLGCGEFENGYAVYLCPECFAEKKVPFSCKSSFLAFPAPAALSVVYPAGSSYLIMISLTQFASLQITT